MKWYQAIQSFTDDQDGAARDWKNAHKIAQKEYNSDGSWVHAYLHREEGDLGNASYWYNNSGKRADLFVWLISQKLFPTFLPT